MMNTDTTTHSLPGFLHSCVKSLKKRHPKLSTTALAKMLDIPNSTFDRIYKQEVKTPSFGHAIKIIQQVCGQESVQDFIKKYYPQMIEDFTRAYPGNSHLPFIGHNAESFLQATYTYEMMMMATSHSGLTMEKAQEKFGSQGIATLNQLIKSGILQQNNDGKIHNNGKTINFCQSTVKKLVQNLLQNNYNIEKFGTNTNWLNVQYESVNLEVVLPHIRHVYIKAAQQVREILNAPESKGDDVIWATAAVDTLEKNNTQTEGPSQ